MLYCSRVVRVRETRLTGVISHVMIGLSMFLLPYPLSYIPAPVLDGLFLYVAITALFGNQLFDRILLFFTEQVGIHIFVAISAYTKENENLTYYLQDRLRLPVSSIRNAPTVSFRIHLPREFENEICKNLY